MTMSENTIPSLTLNPEEENTPATPEATAPAASAAEPAVVTEVIDAPAAAAVAEPAAPGTPTLSLHPDAAPAPVAVAPAPAQEAVPAKIDDSMLSESLAKMYIARGKYSKALEIIESINLNFPEKSIYFADQIRFLRKLVLIETLKNKL